MKDKFGSACEFIVRNFEKFIVLLIIIFPLLIIGLYYSKLVKKAPVREDAVGYYAYLPAIFRYKDLSFNFMISEDHPYTGGVNTFERKFNPGEAEIMGFHKQENGKYFDKYPIGVAILLVPFFLLGHLLTVVFGGQLNGWSFFYQYSAFFGGITYFLLGLIFLKRILKEHFSPKVVLFTMVAIVFGTNLFNYATYENIFSHVYSFFLITFLAYLTPKWLSEMDLKYSLAIGTNVGFIVLVRQTNVIFVLLPLFYGVESLKGLKDRVMTFFKYWKVILISIISSVLIFLPQILYWKFASGHWLTSSYEGEGFSFLRPQIFNVLFSVGKGLFFWSPILIFAVIGMFLLRKSARKYFVASIFVLILQIYLISSWWCWEFGWSFGHRAFIDSFGIFAIGLAGFYSAFKKSWKKSVIFVISLIFIFLSLFQMVQYWLRILPPVWTTWEDYKKIFLRLDKDLVRFWEDKFE